MKYIYAILFLLVGMSLGQTQGIEFYHGTFEEALKEANIQGKAIFVDAYTTWCGPCKRMAKDVFTQEAVGDFFNKKFINLKLDMEKTEGVEFGHKYPVSAYPTLYFINSKGEVLKKVVGGKKPDALIALAKAALMLDDRSGDYEELYLEGNRDFDLVYNYVKALNDVGKPSLKIANDYLNSNPDITEEQRLKFLFVAAVEADSKIFEEMVAHKSAIIEVVGEDAYKARVESACKKTIDKALEFEYEALMHEAIDKSKGELDASVHADLEYQAKMHYYDSFGEDEKYYKAAKEYAKANNSTEVLSFVALDVCDNLKSDKKAMKQAIKWAKEVHKKDKNNESLLTYCRVLLTAEEYDKVLDVLKDAKEDKKNSYSAMQIEQIEREVQKRIKNQRSE